LGLWRNHRYASIICNLERRRIVTLLPDREPATAQAWLAAHPTIAIVARDRGGGYGEATAKALPHAVQIADRWHLMENASRAFLDAVRTSMRQIRSAIGATTIDPKLLTAAERLQYEAICAARRPMRLSWLCRRTAYPSSRSCAKPAIAGSWCDRRSVADATMSSGPGRVHSISICHGSTTNGQPVAETALNFGVA
jgi:transposase